LLTAPETLAAAARTFKGRPLLYWHAGFTTDFPREFIIGRLGDDVAFDGVYLRATVIVADAGAIRAIATGARRFWSIGYFYRPQMTPGAYDGEDYDGQIRDLRGSHLALVAAGRCELETEICW
jgi:hypothetical protein